jgi:hypothetical protein
MSIKKFVVVGALAASVMGVTALADPAMASQGGASVVGSFVVADNGQGCWTGGGLLSDGTATSQGGACSFFVAPGVHEQLKFTSKTWVNNGDGTVTLCATVAPTHAGSDPLGIAPNGLGCVGPVPYNVGPIKFQGMLVKVDLKA